MKVLSIGNSFSQDAHKLLHKVAQADGYDLDTTNLYIAGCSLETHWKNVLSGEADYNMEGNNGEFLRKVSLSEALESEEFDVVTLQQVSYLSGKPQSYFPYLVDLYNLVKEKQPNAKIFFHKTWSYEIDSPLSGFKLYNNDQREMYRRICDAADMVAKVLNVDVIPTGDVIQTLREQFKEFDYKNGGISLCRDSFHLTLDYGRFAAACIWYKTLTGRTLDIKKAISIDEEFDSNLINVILNYINVE